MTDPVASHKQIRIRTAKDIIDALRSPDAGIRFSMLRAVVQDPVKAASYGASGGQDIVDELCAQAGSLTESTLRAMILGALTAYRDPRIKELFKKEVQISGNAETVTMAARYLSGEDDARNILSSLLLQDNSPTHAQAAAEALEGSDGLSDGERIRIALLGGKETPPPVLNDGTEPAWSRELRGPYGPRARQLIEAQGEPSFRYLRKRWDRLADEDKAWLLKWGADSHPAYTIELILSGLDSGRNTLVKASLEAVPRLGTGGGMFKNHIGRHLKDPDPAVRLAACRAGAAGMDWEAALASEEDRSVKMEMLARLMDEKGAAAAPVLIRLIEEGDFRLRAAATDALKSVGKNVVEIIKPLLEHPHLAVNVAAAQVLIVAGEDLWLEERILS